MVDVNQLPANAFGYVPTPALVAPIEFTIPRDLYKKLGGHVDHIVSIEQFLEQRGDSNTEKNSWSDNKPWPLDQV